MFYASGKLEMITTFELENLKISILGDFRHKWEDGF
jgi:hypothetical protein